MEEGPLEEDIWEQLTKHNTNILLLKLKRSELHKQHCYKNQPIRTNDMEEKPTGNPDWNDETSLYTESHWSAYLFDGGVQKEAHETYQG